MQPADGEVRSSDSESRELHLVVGSPQSWEAAYRENVVALYRYIHARTGNRPDAEDVTAAVFLRAMPRLRSGASPGEVRAYLFATARTVLADHWARHYSVEVGLPDEELAVSAEEAVGEGGVRRTTAILARLPANYREVLELRFLRGYSVRETAHTMNISVTNAKVLQWRALRRAARLDGESDA
jgi:RNA polymerase sigma factor (sigma-70 family)